MRAPYNIDGYFFLEIKIINMETPSELYCIVCKTKRPVKDVKRIEKEFPSKSGKTMSRSLWKASCEGCHREINQFAKKIPLPQTFPPPPETPK